MEVSLLYSIEDTQFSIETLDPLEIMSEFINHCRTEYPDILVLDKEATDIPEVFLRCVKNHKRVFILSEISFIKTEELINQVSTSWEDVDTGVNIYLDSHRIVGTRQRVSSSTSRGRFYLQEFFIDTFIPSKGSSLCNETKSLFVKLQNSYMCELMKFPPWEITPSNLKTETETTRLEQEQDHVPHLKLDLLFDIFTMTSVDSVIRCTSVCKLWYEFIRINYVCLQSISKSRFLLAPASDLYEAQNLNFFVLVKPTAALYSTPTAAYMGNYKGDANTFHISEKPLWLPPMASNGFGTQVIGSVNGLVCLTGTHGLNLPDPVTIFNPVTIQSRELPRFHRLYKMFTNCVWGFGFVPEIKRYRLVRVVHPGSNHHQVIHTFTVGVNEQWVFNGLLPKVFGSFLVNGVFVNRHLYFKDAAGKIAVYSLFTEMFDVLRSPPVDLREEADVRSSSLCSHKNKLTVVVLDYVKRITSVWLLKESTGTDTATSTIWEPFLKFETPFTSTIYSLISFTLDNIVWLVDGKRIVSHKTMEMDVEKELQVYGQGLSAEIVGHLFTYVDL